MPFIPHTPDDIRNMLEVLGVSCIDDLFDEIPQVLKSANHSDTDVGISEMEITRLMKNRAEIDGRYLSFLGGGAYEHHIPAAVWQIATEYCSRSAPYQAEAFQGTLQLMYEYQTMMASLTGLDISNDGLCDGASALAEAVLMAVRMHNDARRILLATTINPHYRAVVKTMLAHQNIEIIDLPYDIHSGKVGLDSLFQFENLKFAAVIIGQPNYFGVLESVDEITDWAHQHDALTIGVVNPVALAILKPPGQWGVDGADIAVGEGQPLGIPVSNGGPYFGFMCCKHNLLPQMPGHIVGRTRDRDGQAAYTLRLQTREQYIRRANAASNIGMNQGAIVAAATLYMTLQGPAGLAKTAAASHKNISLFVDRLLSIDGIEKAFLSPVFHECVLRVGVPVTQILRALKAQGILGGIDLTKDYPELGQSILVCATETKVAEDFERYAGHMERILSKRREAPPCAYKN
jgi:glycine dehydrogenase subunit 1